MLRTMTALKLRVIGVRAVLAMSNVDVHGEGHYPHSSTGIPSQNLHTESRLLSQVHVLQKFRDGGGGGSRTRVRKCYWSRDYMLSPVPAPGLHRERSRPALRTDKKRLPLACALSPPAQT